MQTPTRGAVSVMRGSRPKHAARHRAPQTFPRGKRGPHVGVTWDARVPEGTLDLNPLKRLCPRGNADPRPQDLES